MPKRNLRPMTTMRIDPYKLDELAKICKGQFTYDELMGRILHYIKQQPDFEKELLT